MAELRQVRGMGECEAEPAGLVCAKCAQSVRKKSAAGEAMGIGARRAPAEAPNQTARATRAHDPTTSAPGQQRDRDRKVGRSNPPVSQTPVSE